MLLVILMMFPRLQKDYIAGSFYDGFVLYAMALEETLADGGAQNDGINITMRTQNRRFWGEQMWCNMLYFDRLQLVIVLCFTVVCPILDISGT